MAKKSAIEKRDTHPEAKVETLRRPKGPNYPPGRMLVSSPLDVEAIIRKIPKGKVMRLSRLRALLAANAKADYACALTTGIFVRIVAEAAEEERTAGQKRIAPYWRLIRDNGTLIDKLPGGESAHAALLQAEGVACVEKRNRYRVEDIERHAVEKLQART